MVLLSFFDECYAYGSIRLSFGASDAETTAGFRPARFRFGDFFVKMWV